MFWILKNTKTEKNLWEAFAGESMARNKYTYFAKVAKDEGYEQIADIFLETAENEKEHAKLWFDALEELGEPVKYGYWDFGTDASKTAGIDKKPSIGYSPMQEQYAHTPYDKARTDYINKAVLGNAAIFLKATIAGEEAFEELEW